MSTTPTRSRLPRAFPRTLDDVTVRLVAGEVLVVALVAAFTRQPWLFGPLAVDFVRFTNPDKHLSNAPAVLILLPHQIGSKDLAFIVGPNCTTAPDQDIYFVAVVPTSS